MRRCKASSAVRLRGPAGGSGQGHATTSAHRAHLMAPVVAAEELTKRAQNLSAFIAPNGQVFKWKVMPLRLTNARATFQELMNQVVACIKLKPTVQALLKRGAVTEVYIDDVLLGTDDADDHLRLVEEFLRICEECNTHVKLQKCEFMQEEIEYLGFQVG